jgi:hypothetical protein
MTTPGVETARRLFHPRSRFHARILMPTSFSSTRRRRSPWLLALAAAAATAALTAGPAGASDQILYGFNAATPSATTIPSEQFLARMSDSGARLHRLSLSWQSYESYRGVYNDGVLKRYDALYNDELALGIRPVIELFGAPPWSLDPMARKPKGGIPCSDQSLPCLAPPNVRNSSINSAWQNWVRTVVARYPQAAAIEIWNEPNLAWAWIIKQDPVLYARLLASATAASHQVNPAIPVLTGGLASAAGVSDAYVTNMADMLSAVYKTTGAQSFDAISYHNYPCNTADPVPGLQRRHDMLRAVEVQWGDQPRQMWITETGASTSGSTASSCTWGFTESGQAAALQAALKWGQSKFDVAAMLVNSLYNAKPRSNILTENSTPSHEYGVVAWTLTPTFLETAKPAYDAVRCVFRATC